MLGLTQDEVQQAVEISNSTLRRIETVGPDRRHSNIVDRLRALYERYGVTLYETEDGLGIWLTKSALPPLKLKNKKKKQSANPDETPDS